MRRIVFVMLGIVIVLVILGFIPVTMHKEWSVGQKFQYADELISDPKQWKKWYGPIKTLCGNDTTSCTIKRETGNQFSILSPGGRVTVDLLRDFHYSIELKSSHTSSAFIIVLAPDEMMQYAKITAIYKRNLLTRLFPFLTGTNAAEALVNDLKSFLEDSRLFYGFNIRKAPAVGNGLIVKQIIVPQSMRFEYVKSVFAQLEHYIRRDTASLALANNISYIPGRKDSVELIIGIVMPKPVAANDSLSFMQIPAGQQLLVADFEGVYRDKATVYHAMTKYMADHNISGRADLYESFAPGAFPVSDGSVVKMQLCFPFSGR